MASGFVEGFAQAQKKRGARLRRVGFPVYNLMKSFQNRSMIVPLLFVSPPFSFIDDTKVQDADTSAKNRNSSLLKGLLNDVVAQKTQKYANRLEMLVGI